MKATIEVQNLKCGGCAKTITNKLTGLKNINEVAIDVDASLISFQYDNAEDATLVAQTLKTLGYPSVEEDNTLISKAKSYISCATGKMSN